MVPVKTDKNYSYVVEMQREVIEARLQDWRSMKRKRQLEECDPRNIAKTIAPEQPPETDVLVKKKKSRFEST